MNNVTDKVLALALAREASNGTPLADKDFTEICPFLYKFAALIQQQMVADNVVLKEDTKRLDAIEKTGLSVTCNWKNTGFCGPEGYEWDIFIYADQRKRGIWNGKTIRAAIDAAIKGGVK